MSRSASLGVAVREMQVGVPEREAKRALMGLIALPVAP